MRLILLFMILSLFSSQENGSMNQEIFGNWNICFDSLVDNPPTFLTCWFNIEFKEEGSFVFVDHGNDGATIDGGTFKVDYHSEVDGAKIYMLTLNMDKEFEQFFTQYIPSKSLIYISRGDAVLFLTDDTYGLSTPFFLKRIIYEK